MSNQEPNFTGGGTIFGYIVAQWQALFGAKVDANNGFSTNQSLTTPAIINGTMSGTVLSNITISQLGTLTNPITINLNSATAPTSATGALLQVAQADATVSCIEADAFAAATAFTGRRADGTNASKTAVVSGDVLCGFNGIGYTGASYPATPVVAITMYAAENFSSGHQGSEIRLQTTAVASTTLTDRWHVWADGGFYADGVTGASKGAGTINCTGLFINGAAAGVISVNTKTGAVVFSTPTQQIFTSGSGTYTTPAGCTYIVVRLAGGGGGGGGSGTSGGGSSGTNGGNTTFSTLTGSGGSSATSQSAGPGGAASGGDINFPGEAGNNASSDLTTFALAGVAGGASSFFGGRGNAGGPTTAGGNAVANSGGGGGGAGLNGVTGESGGGGGAGGSVQKLITSPAATYSYAVGSAGSGQAAGTSGQAGGNGATGIIIVEEHYI